MPGLKLWLLGSPRVELADEPVELPRRKSLALLVYLALTGEAQPRDRLAALFFPEYDQAGARSALRRDLSALNASLGPGWLDADRESIALRRELNAAAVPQPVCWLDIQQFRGLLAACDKHGHPAAAVCPACLPVLGEAVGLHRAEFLAGFTLKDSPGFDEWQFFQAESLRQELAGALERLVNGYCGLGEDGGLPGIPYARQWVALDPLHEPAQRLLMQLYASIGRPAAALRQYAECARVLDAELGVPPAEETTRLYEAIKGQRLRVESSAGQAPHPQQSAVRATVAEPLPDQYGTLYPDGAETGEVSTFVGHEPELARLDHYLNVALGGQNQAVFVTGEAGTGKTSLVQEFARRSQMRQPALIVARGNCNAYTGLGDPYLPFREILAHLAGDADATSIASTAARASAQRMQAFAPRTVQAIVEMGPDLLDTFVSSRALISRAGEVTQKRGWEDGLKELIARQEARQGSSNVKQADLFEQYVKVIQSLAGQRPLMLVLDDLQWADAGSINLLFDLGRRLRGGRILVVGIFRPAEVALGRASGGQRIEDGALVVERERHPLESLVNEFQQRFGDIVVDLGQSADIRFIDAFLDSQENDLGPGFREALFRHTGAHALFTVEMVRGMQERGDIVKDEHGRWVEGRELNWEILPARVEGVIGERIGRLTPLLREMLKVASVEGEIFTAEVVARVQAGEERAVVRLLSGELDRQHRLVRNESSRRLGPDGQQVSQYRFRHILFQKYLYKELDDAERSYLHEAVGQVLERLYGEETETVSVQLARHFEAAGRPAKAVQYLKQAGERAVRLSANEEALVHFTRALHAACHAAAESRHAPAGAGPANCAFRPVGGGQGLRDPGGGAGVHPGARVVRADRRPWAVVPGALWPVGLQPGAHEPRHFAGPGARSAWRWPRHRRTERSCWRATGSWARPPTTGAKWSRRASTSNEAGRCTIRKSIATTRPYTGRIPAWRSCPTDRSLFGTLDTRTRPRRGAARQ